MIYLRSVLFNVYWIVWTVSMTLLTACTLILPASRSRDVGQLWAKGTAIGLRILAGVKMEVRGREKLPEGAYLVASKHQSAWETAIFLDLLPWCVYTLKIELIQFPVFGHCLRHMGYVGVDRKGGARALRDLVEGTKDALEKGRQVVIFPEGRRVAVDTKERYHPGVAALYSQTGATVVPVALNSGLFWGRNSFLKHPGTIVIEFLEPLEPGMDRREFLRVLEDRIETHSQKLSEEAGRSPPVEASSEDKPLEPSTRPQEPSRKSS